MKCISIQKIENILELNKQTCETITSGSASLWIRIGIKTRGRQNPDPKDGVMELYNCEPGAGTDH